MNEWKVRQYSYFVRLFHTSRPLRSVELGKEWQAVHDWGESATISLLCQTIPHLHTSEKCRTKWEVKNSGFHGQGWTWLGSIGRLLSATYHSDGFNTSKTDAFILLPCLATYKYFSIYKLITEPIYLLLEDQKSEIICKRNIQATRLSMERLVYYDLLCFLAINSLFQTKTCFTEKFSPKRHERF